jgi:hypothetical protein
VPVYETVSAFEETWIKCLGDLGRYRMAIEDDDVRDGEIWQSCAQFWYSKVVDTNPNVGRLYHHLAILARPTILHQFFFYCNSLGVVRPSSPENSRTECPTNTDISPPDCDTVVENFGGTVPTSNSTMSGIRFRRNKHLAGCNSHEKDTTKHRKVKPTNTLIQFSWFMIGAKERVWDLAASLKYRLVQLDETFNVPSVRDQSNSNGWIDNVSLRFFTQGLCKSLGVFHSECRDPHTLLTTSIFLYGVYVEIHLQSSMFILRPLRTAMTQ